MDKIILHGKYGDGKFALVSTEDFEYLNGFRWSLTGAKRYVARKLWNGGNSKYIYMHKEVLGISDTKTVGDHINGDTLDNRRENLRIATHAQNSWNRGKGKVGGVTYKGVWLQDNHYVSRIKVAGKDIYLGFFKTPIEAAKAYNEAAIKYHGEFASINEL